MSEELMREDLLGVKDPSLRRDDRDILDQVSLTIQTGAGHGFLGYVSREAGAADVKKGDQVLSLRDESGFPVWSGWRRR